jgi:hypothetical protein
MVNAGFARRRSARKIMIKTILFILLVAIFAGVAAAQSERWTGIYTFDEESLDAGSARTSYWFRLEVKEVDGKLVGIYSEGVNGQAVRRFQLAVKTEGNKVAFYYDRGLPRVEGVNETCTESEFGSGELMFEFEEVPRHCKTEILTIWHKINLARQTEAAESGDEVLFFKRI